MSLADLLSTLIGTVVLGAIVVAANVADRQGRVWLKRSVIAVLLLFNILIVIAFGLTPLMAVSSDTNTTYQVERVKLVGGLVNPTHMREVTSLKESAALGAFVLALIVGGLATAVLFRPFRQTIAFLFPRHRRAVEPPIAIAPPPVFVPGTASKPEETAPLFPQMLNYYTQESMVLPGPTTMPYRPLVPVQSASIYQSRGYNPDSTVHMVALAFIIYLVGTQFVNYILGGGLEGVAQGLSGLTVLDIVISDLPFVLVPLLGVGIGIRRNWRQTFDRLGLHLPTGEGLGVAVGMTIALLIFVAVASTIWQQFVSKQTLEDQTKASEALSSNVDTIFMAFALAATAAIAEELAFRGAMQPVFGFWTTAIVFTMIHLQYTLTPASLMILVVAIAFGWIRQRYSTTVAMMTHFLYNFIPLVLVAATSEQSLIWLTHLL